MPDFVLRISIPDDMGSITQEQWIADTIHRAACRMISHPLDRAVVSPDSDAVVGGWLITDSFSLPRSAVSNNSLVSLSDDERSFIATALLAYRDVCAVERDAIILLKDAAPRGIDSIHLSSVKSLDVAAQTSIMLAGKFK